MTNHKPWTWTPQKELAALLIAQGRLPMVRLAEKVNVNRDTLLQWSKAPEFTERIQEHLEQIKEECREENRVRWQWREAVARNLAEALKALTKDDFEIILANPMAAINTMLKLENSYEKTDKRRKAFEEEYDLPTIREDISEETAERLLAIGISLRAERDAQLASRAELRAVPGTDAELPPPQLAIETPRASA